MPCQVQHCLLLTRSGPSWSNCNSNMDHLRSGILLHYRHPSSSAFSNSGNSSIWVLAGRWRGRMLLSHEFGEIDVNRLRKLYCHLATLRTIQSVSVWYFSTYCSSRHNITPSPSYSPWPSLALYLSHCPRLVQPL